MILAVVDGGATGCRLRLHDRAGALLGTGHGGPASLTLGVAQAWGNIGAAFREAQTAAGDALPARHDLHLAVGLAGARSPDNRAAFHALAPLPCASLMIVTDGYSSLIGAMAGAPGIAIAIGTGVTGYALWPDGSVHEAGGWGFPVGDEGSGAWIGWRGLQATTQWWDRRLTRKSAVFQSILDRVGGDFDAIQSWLRDARSTEFASLAPLVVAAAEAGDLLAETILRDAVTEHEKLIAAIDTGDATLPIALLGGLGEVFAPRLARQYQARIVPAKGNALSGLLRLLQDHLDERGVA